MYYLFTKAYILIGHSELGCSVTLGTSSTNFYFIYLLFFVQIAQGQVEETVAEVIGGL